MKFGIDRLLTDPQLRAPLEGKRVALVAHPASVTADLTHSLDALIAAGINVTAAFGPQHGLKGDKQDNMVETADETDPQYGIPIFSLYGEVRRPTGQMMSAADVFLFDLQDLGFLELLSPELVQPVGRLHGQLQLAGTLAAPEPAGELLLEGFGVEHELPTLAAAVGGGDGDLAAELVWLVRLALADAFGLRCMPGVELAPALVLTLQSDLCRLGQGWGKGGFQRLVSSDLALDVAPQAAQARAQKLQHPVAPIELLGVGIAAGPHGGSLCHPHIGLA